MVIALLALLLSAQPVAQTNTPAEIALARATVERLGKGDFAAVQETFSAKMRAAMPEERLRANWQRLQEQTGPLLKIGEAQFRDRSPLRSVVLPVHFEKRMVRIEVVINQAGEVAGLLFG